MTAFRLRPTATVVGSMAIEASTSHWEALTDDNELTYVHAQSAGQNAVVEMSNLALPAGAAVREVRALIKQGWSSGAYHVVWIRDAAGTVLLEQAFLGTASITTMSTGGLFLPLTEAEVNGLQWADYATAAPARVYEAYLDVWYVEQATVTVAAPTGTRTDTNRPAIIWATEFDTDGGPQTHTQVKLFTQAQYTAGGFTPDTATPLQQSGIVTGGSTSWTWTWRPPEILPNLTTYRAYVRTAQTVNGAVHWSAWGFSTFTIDVALPPEPTVTLTAEANEGRNQIAVAAGAGTPSTDALDVQRSLDGGVTWGSVRHAGGLIDRIAAGSATLYDYESPNGESVAYRARALHNYSGEYAASAWATASVTWSSGEWWIKDVLAPSRNVPVELVTYGDVSRAARTGFFQPFGASLPVAVADTPAGATGTSTVRTRTNADKDAVEATIGQPRTLLLQGPAAAGEPDRYVRLVDLNTARLIENIARPARTITIPWAEVRQPDGAQTGDQYTAPATGGEELVLI